jgi:hypothetical protein
MLIGMILNTLALLVEIDLALGFFFLMSNLSEG